MALPPFPEPESVEGGVAVFADAHLGQAGGDGEDFLGALEEVASREIRTIVFLGDIFRYFIGDAKFETPLVRRVLDGWRDLAARGVSLRYVEGNRDFFLAGSPYAASFARYGLTDGLDVGGRRWAFVHGDLVNTGDLPYRFWRIASKNPLSRAVMNLLPGAIARSIVAGAEARLYTTNLRHKRRLPVARLEAEAMRAREAGYGEVLVGHFHREWRSERPEGSVHVLPAWFEERRHAEIAPEGSLRVVLEPTASRALKREAPGVDP